MVASQARCPTYVLAVAVSPCLHLLTEHSPLGWHHLAKGNYFRRSEGASPPHLARQCSLDR